MALSADRVTKQKGGTARRQRYKVAATTTIYAGGMVCLNATGYAVPAANTTAFTGVKGIAVAKADNAAGLDGAIDVIVEYGIAFLLNCHASITQADVGRGAFVTDDQTVCDAAQSTQNIYVGQVLEFVDEAQDKCWVNILGDGALGATPTLASIGSEALKMFASAEQTATGSAQNVAHGLGVAPTHVLIALTEHPGTPDTGAFDIAEGTHTSTNVVLTVTVNCKFKVLAFA